MQSFGFLKHNKISYEHTFDKQLGTTYLVNTTTNKKVFSVDSNGFIRNADRKLPGKIQFTRDTSAAGHHYDLVLEDKTIHTNEIGLPGAEKTSFRYFLNNQ